MPTILAKSSISGVWLGSESASKSAIVRLGKGKEIIKVHKTLVEQH